MRKQIFSYWHQGFGQAPDLVQMCIRSLIANHQEWDVHLLDADSVDEWLDPIPIPDFKWRKLPLAHQSDVIRTQLLIKYGGVWADPTIWFSRSMDDWLDSVMGSGLFLFHRPGPDRLISNWFIAASPGNVILQKLYENLCLYWSGNNFDNIGGESRKMELFLARILNRNLWLPRLWLTWPVKRILKLAPYMTYHFHFVELVSSDPECKSIWDNVPEVSAIPPHALQRHGLFNSATDSIRRLVRSGEPPLFKLTWKLPQSAVPPDSVVNYLLSLSSDETLSTHWN